MFVSTFSCQICLQTEIALILFVYGVFLSEGAVPGPKEADDSDNIPKRLKAGNSLSSSLATAKFDCSAF